MPPLLACSRAAAATLKGADCEHLDVSVRPSSHSFILQVPAAADVTAALIS